VQRNQLPPYYPLGHRLARKWRLEDLAYHLLRRLVCA